MRRLPQPPEEEGLFVLEHANRKVVVVRPSTYDDALDSAIKQFPALVTTPRAQIRLFTTKLAAAGGEAVELSSESWAVVSKVLDSVTVTVVPDPQPTVPALKFVVTEPEENHRDVHQNGGSVEGAFVAKADFRGHISMFKVAPTTRFGLLRTAILHRFGLPEGRARIHWDNPNSDSSDSFVPDDTTLSKAGITEEAKIHVTWEDFGPQYAGICLWSPIPQRAEVYLRLLSCWGRVEMALPPAVETLTPLVDAGSQTDIQWVVDTRDKVLRDVRSSFECQTLYWKAPLRVYPGDDLYLDDLNAAVVPILPVRRLVAYLSDAFAGLRIPVKAGEAFMAHTLSQVLGRHNHLAIRFVSQNLFSKHAELSVRPLPHIQSRIILLYKEIHGSEHENWPNASTRRELGGEYWKNVVGITDEVTNMLEDESLFRVFEWGTVKVD